MEKIDPLQQLFEPINRRRTFPKGAIIIMQGGSLDEIYRITNGLVRAYDIDNNGSQRTVALFGKHHIIPANWLLFEPTDYGSLYFYQAVTQVVCYATLRDEAWNFLKTHPKVWQLLLDAVNKSYLNSLARIQNLERSHVNERVNFIMYYLAIVFGHPSDNKRVYEIPAVITHQEIADLAGLSRETISNYFVDNGYKNILKKEGSRTFIYLNKIDIKNMPKLFHI